MQPEALPVELAAPRHVSRKKMSLMLVVVFAKRFVEMDAKATNSPVVLTEGPAVASVGMLPEQVAPQIPLFAGAPSGARSTTTGSPAESVGFTATKIALDVPPPGDGFTTVI